MLKVYIFKDLKNLEHCYASICQKSGSSEHILAYILTITKQFKSLCFILKFDYYTDIYFLFCFRLHSNDFK